MALALNARAEELIESLALERHPEGGWYRQIFKSSRIVQRDSDIRNAVTAIYFLLAGGEQSAWHRVQSDEIWIHLEGSPLTLSIGDETRVLDPSSRIAVVPAGVWQAARIADDYALVSCVVAPGFEFEDFELR